MTSRALTIGFLSIAVLAMAGASWELYDAYRWVDHSAHVRGILIQALVSAQKASEPSECTELHHAIDGFENLTRSRPAQQNRAREMRELAGSACRGNIDAQASLEAVLSSADSSEEFLQETRDRRLRWIAITLAALFTIAIVGATALAATLNAGRKRAAADLAASEERFRLLAESATDLIRIHEPNGQTIYATPSSERLLGYTPAEMVALAPLTTLVHPDEVAQLRATLLKRGENDGKAVRHRLRKKDGTYRWFETQTHQVFDEDGKLVRFYATSRDIDERVEAERKLEALAITDEGTKLHNRRGFMLLAEHQHELAVREGRALLVVYADLDELKAINDEHGHEQGDIAIRDFAGVLRSVFRASDIVARIGGDEFVALAFDGASDGQSAIETRIREALAEYNVAEKRPFKLSASIGVARWQPGSERTLEELLDEADKQMYARKRASKHPRRLGT